MSPESKPSSSADWRGFGFFIRGSFFVYCRAHFRKAGEALDLVPLQEFIDPHFDARQLVSFFGSDEREGHALVPHSARASHAMDVIVAERRNVVINNVRNPGNVDSSPDHVRGDQVPGFTRPEGRHYTVAAPLLEVAVDRLDALHFTGEPVCDLFHAALGPAENDRLMRIFA